MSQTGDMDSIVRVPKGQEALLRCVGIIMKWSFMERSRAVLPLLTQPGQSRQGVIRATRRPRFLINLGWIISHVCIYYAIHTVKDERIFKIAASPLFMRPIGSKMDFSFEV